MVYMPVHQVSRFLLTVALLSVGVHALTPLPRVGSAARTAQRLAVAERAEAQQVQHQAAAATNISIPRPQTPPGPLLLVDGLAASRQNYSREQLVPSGQPLSPGAGFPGAITNGSVSAGIVELVKTEPHDLVVLGNRDRSTDIPPGDVGQLFEEADYDSEEPEEAQGDLVSADTSSRPSAEVAHHSRHKLMHAALLNNESFWVLSGAIVFAVGLAVVGLEYAANVSESESASPPAEEANETNIANFLFCVVSLTTSMVIVGIAQEYVMTNQYRLPDGKREAMPSGWFVVLCNRIVTMVFVLTIMRIRGTSPFFSGFMSAVAPSIAGAVASACQYISLHYVTYTLQTTVKSAKLVPVVVLDSLRGKSHSIQDYAEVILVTTALIIFGLQTEEDSGSSKATAIGVILLIVLVLAESFIPHLQDEVFKKHPDVDATQATFAMAVMTSIGILVLLLCNGSLFGCVAFLARHPDALLQSVVVSLSSTLTQYLTTYTVRSFGPVVVTLIVTNRQVISVCLSAVLFKHYIPHLAVIAACIIFGLLALRALRSLWAELERRQAISESGAFSAAETLLRRAWRLDSPLVQPNKFVQFLLCGAAIHIVLCFYAVTQEYIAVHHFNGRRFDFPLVLAALNRTACMLFALGILLFERRPLWTPEMRLTLLPAMPCLLGIICQYKVLFSMTYPAQTLMKSMKVLPVMICSRIMKNRSYSLFDYAEALLITLLVGFFVWDFELQGNLLHPTAQVGARVTWGGLMMAGCILSDSLSTNFEDYVYQATQMSPMRQMFGIEGFSCLVAWLVLLFCPGEASEALQFVIDQPQVLQSVALLALSSASGTYVCVLTIRLFGPAVFALLLVSRRILSLVLSMVIYRHTVDVLGCFCLVTVSLMVLMASLRQVNAQRGKQPLRPSGIVG